VRELSPPIAWRAARIKARAFSSDLNLAPVFSTIAPKPMKNTETHKTVIMNLFIIGLQKGFWQNEPHYI
jgi:hypothetical protein